MGRIEFNSKCLAPPCPEMAEIVAQIAADDNPEPEQQGEKRHRVAVPVTVVGLDAKNEPVGDPWVALTTSISPHCIGFVNPTPVDAERLAVELPLSHRPQYMLEVVWSRPLDRFFSVDTKIVGQFA